MNVREAAGIAVLIYVQMAVSIPVKVRARLPVKVRKRIRKPVTAAGGLVLEVVRPTVIIPVPRTVLTVVWKNA
jgi:hypothetical protein